MIRKEFIPLINTSVNIFLHQGASPDRIIKNSKIIDVGEIYLVLASQSLGSGVRIINIKDIKRIEWMEKKELASDAQSTGTDS